MGRVVPNLLAALLIAVVFGVCGWVMWRGLNPEPAADTRAVDIPAGDLEKLSGKSAVPEHPRDWSHFDTGNGFTFFAPFGTGRERLRGEDSIVGRITGLRFRLDYDFGHYSNSLEGARSAPGYSEVHLKIDGRPAIIRRARMRDPQTGWSYWVGLYIPKATWVWEHSLDGTWTALAIEGSAATEEDRKVVEQMLSTIAFDRPLPRGVQL